MSPYGANPNYGGTPNANFNANMGGMGMNANVGATPYGMNARVNF